MHVNRCCNSFIKNVVKKEAENILKYKDLLIEVQRMWNVKAEVKPLVTGATGTITQSLRQYLSNISGKHGVKELQKTAVLDTAHLLRKVVMQKYKPYLTCEIIADT